MFSAGGERLGTLVDTHVFSLAEALHNNRRQDGEMRLGSLLYFIVNYKSYIGIKILKTHHAT